MINRPQVIIHNDLNLYDQNYTDQEILLLLLKRSDINKKTSAKIRHFTSRTARGPAVHQNFSKTHFIQNDGITRITKFWPRHHKEEGPAHDSLAF